MAIDITVACTPSSTIITAPVFDNVQNYELNMNQDPRFTFPKFLTTEPNCPITYTINPSAGNTFMDSFVYDWDVLGDSYVQVVANRRNIVQTYKFTITADAEGGATYTSPEFTLNTVCGPASFDTLTPAATIGVFTNTLAQTVEIGTSSVYFLADSLANNWLPDCPIAQVMYETASGSDIASTDFVGSASDTPVSGSEYHAVPVNAWAAASYSMSIKITFAGGGVYRYAPCTLDLTCGLSSQSLTFSS
jgi:hypothetical protein